MSSLPPDTEFDPTPFDDRIRAVFDDAATPPLPPSGRAWAGVQAHLQPTPSNRPTGPALLGGALGLIAGVLLMLGLGGAPPLPDATAPVAAVSANVREGSPNIREVVPNIRDVVPNIREASPNIREASPNIREEVPNIREGVPNIRDVVPNIREAVPNIRDVVPNIRGEQPMTLAAAPSVLLPLVQAETAYGLLPAGDSAAETRAARRQALLTERAALAALTHRTDSLLLTLGVLPEVPPALAAMPAPARPDSAAAVMPRRRWSVAVLFAPERNFFGLQSPAGDTLSALRRTHEQGSRGFSASLLAEYRINDRWSVAGGAGLSSYGAELRLTNQRTTFGLTYDTTLTTVVTGHEVTTRAWSIRVTQIAQANPILNVNNQVIGYDTVYVPQRDTVWTYLVRTDTVRSTQQALTPRLTKHEVASTQVLRPYYRFLTLPIMVRYRLGNPEVSGNRWWADVTVGAQVQAFLGGTQLTSADGRTWRTERVGPADGPFRTISVALLGSVGLNYALSPRLSASVAPSLRYQPISVYKARTGLTQRPAAAGVQLGLKLDF